MEENLLKGNFVTKRKVSTKSDSDPVLTSSEKISRDLRETALQALGGSMVYVERTHLTWDGSSEKKE